MTALDIAARDNEGLDIVRLLVNGVADVTIAALAHAAVVRNAPLYDFLRGMTPYLIFPDGELWDLFAPQSAEEQGKGK